MRIKEDTIGCYDEPPDACFGGEMQRERRRYAEECAKLCDSLAEKMRVLSEKAQQRNSIEIGAELQQHSEEVTHLAAKFRKI